MAVSELLEDAYRAPIIRISRITHKAEVHGEVKSTCSRILAESVAPVMTLCSPLIRCSAGGAAHKWRIATREVISLDKKSSIWEIWTYVNSEDVINRFAEIFKALSNPNRLRIFLRLVSYAVRREPSALQNRRSDSV